MAVHTLEKVENSGIVKKIDPNALNMMIKSSQTEYQFPIDSFIRESFSNGSDSVKEREVARKIIISGKPMEDYYLNRNEAEVKDSNFNPSYYDFKHLSNKESVDIIYQHRDNDQKDKVYVIDEGVGLGGSRLQGYFSIGWSSKRNSAFTIGRFGIGAKAALATNVDYFQMTTIYNGFETSFLIYLHNYTCIIPETEADRTDIWKVEKLSDGEVIPFDQPIHWKKTNKPNGVTIELEMRKMNHNKFVTAVKDQLLYFGDEVNFFEQYNNEEKIKINIKQNIIFETDNCIVASHNQFSHPHLVLNKVNYRKVHWAELDLEEKPGRIGIKVPPSDLDISNSREVIKYNTKAREVLLNKVDLITADVSKYLEDQLNITHHIDWLLAASNILNTNKDEVVSAMEGFIDKTKLTLSQDIKDVWDQLSPESKKVIPKKIRANMPTFMLFFSTYNTSIVYEGIEHSETFKSFGTMGSSFMIYGDKKTKLTQKLKAFIFSQIDGDSFIYLRKAEGLNPDMPIYKTSKITYGASEEFSTVILKQYGTRLDSYEITEEFEKSYTESHKELEPILGDGDGEKDITKPKIRLTAEERRKLNSEIYYKECVIDTNIYGSNQRNKFWFSGNNIKIDRLEKGLNEVIIWGNKKHKSLLEVLSVMTLNSLKHKNISIIMVNQKNSRLFKEFKNYINVEQYIKQMTNGGFKLGELLKEYSTRFEVAKLITENPVLKKLDQYKGIIPEFTSELNSIIPFINSTFNMYLEGKEADQLTLRDFKALISKDHDSEEHITDAMADFMKKAVEINLLSVAGKKDEAEKKCKEYYKAEKFVEIDAIDYEMISSVKSIVEIIKPIEPLVKILEGKSISEEAIKLLLLLRKSVDQLDETEEITDSSNINN